MPSWLGLSRFAVTLIVMLVGLFGLVVPGFPALVVIWLAALGYGLVAGFPTLGVVLFILITVLMIVGSLVDNLFMGAGARQGGASWLALGIATVAGIAGTIFFPPLGGLLAAPLSVLLVETIRQRSFQKALQAFRGLATGWGLAFVVRFGIGVLMIIAWIVWDWKG